MELKPYEKYKDSGIAWIGNIPDGWDVKKLKFACVLRNEKTIRFDLPYVALEHIESGTGRLLKDMEDEKQPESESMCFYADDVLFGKLRPYLAKSFLRLFR